MQKPADYVWYLEVKHPTGKVSQGSAVALRLHEVKDGKPDPNSGRVYLLTCVHVLRGQAMGDDRYGNGRLVPESAIRAWPPGVGRLDDQATRVRIRQDIRSVSVDELNAGDRTAEVLDWVVLEIADKNAALSAESLYLDDFYEIAMKPRPSAAIASFSENDYLIFGYPGGEDSHLDGIVKPTPVGPFKFRHCDESQILLTGSNTAPGLSGGGIFGVCRPHESPEATDSYLFAGLHRSRDKGTLELQGVRGNLIIRHFQQDIVPFDISRRKIAEGDRGKVVDPDGDSLDSVVEFDSSMDRVAFPEAQLLGNQTKFMIVYAMSILFIAAQSLMMSYRKSTLAWELRYAYPLGPSENTAPVGLWLELVLCITLVAFQFLLFYFAFPGAASQLMRIACGQAKTVSTENVASFKWSCALTLVISVLASFGIVDYHLNRAPKNLYVWAKVASETGVEPDSKQSVSEEDQVGLRKESETEAVVDRYRYQYVWYMPYSFCNFILIAQPCILLLLYVVFGDLVKLQQMKSMILDKRNYVKTVSLRFPEFERFVRRILLRSLYCLAAFSLVSVWFLLFNSLSPVAKQITGFAALIVISGPVIGIAASVFVYEFVFMSVESEFEQASWLTEEAKEKFSAKYSMAFRRLLARHIVLVVLSALSVFVVLFVIFKS